LLPARLQGISCRAETATGNSSRDSLIRADEARALLRVLHATQADRLPDLLQKNSTVRVHHLAQLRS
jgi:hypothetical protein